MRPGTAGRKTQQKIDGSLTPLQPIKGDKYDRSIKPDQPQFRRNRFGRRGAPALRSMDPRNGLPSTGGIVQRRQKRRALRAQVLPGMPHQASRLVSAYQKMQERSPALAFFVAYSSFCLPY